MNYVIFYTLCILRSCHDTNVVLHYSTFDDCANIGRAATRELLYVDPEALLTWQCLPAQGPVAEPDNVLMTADEIMLNSTVPVPDYDAAIPAYIGSATIDGPHTITMGVPPSTVGDFTPKALEKIRDACRSAKDKGAP